MYCTEKRTRKDISEYDFVRLTWCDIMGVVRSKVVANHAYEKAVKSGIGMCEATALLDASSDPTPFPRFTNNGYPDCLMIPEADTLHDCPWSGKKSGRKIGEVFCQLHTKNAVKTPSLFDVRYIAKRLLSTLESEFGLKLLSAFEYEFVLGKDRKPAHEGIHIFSSVVLKAYEDVCYEISDRLKAAGVMTEAINVELGAGQYEITMEPVMGIDGADNAFIYKDCVKETAIDYGLEASFMCNPWGDVQTGGHYNFSLWDAKGQEQHSSLTDVSDADMLSDTAKHWIAGVLQHAPALCALVCQTNNCFNRFYEGGFAPFNICYATEHRYAMLRVKQSGSSGCYLEYRTSGSAANPYLVMSAIVAAGMDGLRNKMQVKKLLELFENLCSILTIFFFLATTNWFQQSEAAAHDPGSGFGCPGRGQSHLRGLRP